MAANTWVWPVGRYRLHAVRSTDALGVTQLWCGSTVQRVEVRISGLDKCAKCAKAMTRALRVKRGH